MPNDLPPSGPWAGYYLYGNSGIKHRMRLQLTFSRDGKIDGDGIDDIASFVIQGQFDFATCQVRWAKTYLGMHTVEYSGVYCQRAICGDWTLMRATGGFWIWPHTLGQSESAEEQKELDEPLEVG